MILVVQTVRIGKMRAGHAELLRLSVHQLDKARRIAGDVLRNHVAGLVCGRNHNTVQQLTQAELLAHL